MTDAPTFRRRRSSPVRRRLALLAERFLAYGLLSIFLLVWAFPLYWIINTAFKYKAQIQSFQPVWLPIPFKTGNFTWIWENLEWSAAVTSAETVLFSLFVAMLFGPAIAYALTRFRTAANKHLAFWIISTRMMPPAALIIPYYFLLLNTNLLNTTLGLALLYSAINLPLATWIMLAFFKNLPVSPENAAKVDGCSNWQAFWYIVVPSTRSSLAAAALITIILTWNEFFIAFIVTSSNITLPVQVASFLSTGLNPQFGHMAAAGIVQSLPTVLLALIFRKHFITGLHAFAGIK